MYYIIINNTYFVTTIIIHDAMISESQRVITKGHMTLAVHTCLINNQISIKYNIFK